jgi:Protein tyrosine and serine/threonine kinase
MTAAAAPLPSSAVAARVLSPTSNSDLSARASLFGEATVRLHGRGAECASIAARLLPEPLEASPGDAEVLTDFDSTNGTRMRSVVLLRAPAGMGKSAVLERVRVDWRSEMSRRGWADLNSAKQPSPKTSGSDSSFSDDANRPVYAIVSVVCQHGQPGRTAVVETLRSLLEIHWRLSSPLSSTAGGFRTENLEHAVASLLARAGPDASPIARDLWAMDPVLSTSFGDKPEHRCEGPMIEGKERLSCVDTLLFALLQICTAQLPRRLELLLLVEDLHWAGKAGRDMFASWICQRDFPLLALVSSRPADGWECDDAEATRSMRALRPSMTVDLEPLSDRLLVLCAADALSVPVDQLPERIVAQIRRSANGLPLVAESIALSWTAASSRVENGNEASRSEDFLVSSVTGRVMMLAPLEADVIWIMAVIRAVGVPGLSAGALLAMLRRASKVGADLNDDNVAAAATRLQRQRLLRPAPASKKLGARDGHPSGAHLWTFYHDSIEKAVSTAIDDSVARQWHQAALWHLLGDSGSFSINSNSPGGTVEYHPVDSLAALSLARHVTLGGLPPRHEYIVPIFRAATDARVEGRMQDALELSEAGLSFLRGLPKAVPDSLIGGRHPKAIAICFLDISINARLVLHEDDSSGARTRYGQFLLAIGLPTPGAAPAEGLVAELVDMFVSSLDFHKPSWCDALAVQSIISSAWVIDLVYSGEDWYWIPSALSVIMLKYDPFAWRCDEQAKLTVLFIVGMLATIAENMVMRVAVERHFDKAASFRFATSGSCFHPRNLRLMAESSRKLMLGFLKTPRCDLGFDCGATASWTLLVEGDIDAALGVMTEFDRHCPTPWIVLAAPIPSQSRAVIEATACLLRDQVEDAREGLVKFGDVSQLDEDNRRFSNCALRLWIDFLTPHSARTFARKAALLDFVEAVDGVDDTYSYTFRSFIGAWQTLEILTILLCDERYDLGELDLLRPFDRLVKHLFDAAPTHLRPAAFFWLGRGMEIRGDLERGAVAIQRSLRAVERNIRENPSHLWEGRFRAQILYHIGQMQRVDQSLEVVVPREAKSVWDAEPSIRSFVQHPRYWSGTYALLPDKVAHERVKHFRFLEGLILGKGIGEGHFGQVFEASWHNAVVAAKLAESATVYHFLEEAHTMKALRHPHVVNFFGVAKLDDDRHAIVMELVHGGSALDFVKRSHTSALTTSDLTWLVRDVCAGLAYLHGEGWARP